MVAGYVRLGRMDLDTGIQILSEAEAHMRSREYAVGSPDVLRLIPQCQRSAYDLEFVVLARDLGVRLVTTDSDLRKDFPKEAISMRDFLMRDEGAWIVASTSLVTGGSRA